MSRTITVSLPVADLKASKALYTALAARRTRWKGGELQGSGAARRRLPRMGRTTCDVSAINDAQKCANVPREERAWHG